MARPVITTVTLGLALALGPTPVRQVLAAPPAANTSVLPEGNRLASPTGVDDVGGGVTLDGWMLKPSSVDPARRSPLLMHGYGEPAGVTVTNQWQGANGLFHRTLAEAGYVVASLDNRST